MSWLTENLGSSFTATGADPNTFTPGYFAHVKQYNPAYYDSIKEYDPIYKSEQQAAQQAQEAATIAAQTGAAATTNIPKGPTQAESASAALAQLLQGFGGVPGGANLVPGSLDDPAIESVFGTQRSKAQDYINNLVKRGVVTPEGQQRGVSALDTQAPGVRSKLNDIGNLLLEQERGKVRGIYNEGATAAGSVGAGQGFDPTPYVTRAQSDVSGFSGGLSDAIAAQVPGDLFDTSGLASSSGAPSSGQTNLDYDPYAVSGGQLKTGDSALSTGSTKRRSTAVF